MSKFYQLEPDEWLTACQELKAAELKILYRLRTLSPFGNKAVRFKVVDIAKDLGMNKGTVSRGLKALSQLGYIDIEIVEAIATLTTKGKALSTDNQVVHTQPDSENTRLSTDNLVVYRSSKLSTDHPSCPQTTSAISTQPDTPESGSGHGTDLSKISLDQLDQLDQIDQENFSDFSNSENSEFAQSIFECTDQAIAQIETLELVQSDELAETTDEVVNPINGDSFRRALEDFILKTLELSPRNRKSYFSKFTPENWEGWEDRYRIFLNQPRAKNFARPQDPHIVEQSISIAVKCKDFDFARCKIDELSKSNPSLAAELMIKFFGQEVTK